VSFIPEINDSVIRFVIYADQNCRLLFCDAFDGKESRSELVLPGISQDSLAQMIGTTTSRVSHFMNTFRKPGFIDYSDNNGLTLNSGRLSVVLHD
jgi:CRP/FNR family transcriptional regulator, cyclic AMP receptor protein